MLYTRRDKTVLLSQIVWCEWGIKRSRAAPLNAASLNKALRNGDRQLHSTIRYDARCYFNARSKADVSQLNLLHSTD